jgi:hypothetical protein
MRRQPVYDKQEYITESATDGYYLSREITSTAVVGSKIGAKRFEHGLASDALSVDMPHCCTTCTTGKNSGEVDPGFSGF